ASSASTTPPGPTRTAPAQPPAATQQDAVVKASQQYFRSVVDIVDALKGQQTPTYASMKLWYDRYAKQIEELPLLNVDTELLEWGSKVARTLREMSMGINYSAKDQSYRLAGISHGSYDS